MATPMRPRRDSLKHSTTVMRLENNLDFQQGGIIGFKSVAAVFFYIYIFFTLISTEEDIINQS